MDENGGNSVLEVIEISNISSLQILELGKMFKQTRFSIFFFIFIFIFLFSDPTLCNYIINEGFETPAIPATSIVLYGTVEGWTGKFEVKGRSYGPRQMSGNQYIDLATTSNGYITQTVVLPAKGTYVLAYDQIPQNNNYQSYEAGIYWNNSLIGVAQPNTTVMTTNYLIFDSAAGTAELSFVQIGTQDMFGIYLDNICLEKMSNYSCGIIFQNYTEPEDNTQQQLQTQEQEQPSVYSVYLSYAYSLPLNQLGPLKYLGVIVEDLSIYFYDRRYYNHTMQEVLVTLNYVESKKWALMNFAAYLPIGMGVVPASNITAYSNPKHVEVDGVDDCFMRGVFPFIAFMVPQTIILVLLLRAVFCCIAQYKISIFLRRYFFIFASILQICTEGNVSYFTYLFFRQALVFFSFNFIDKAYLMLSTIIFFMILVTGCSFYFISNYLYGKGFGYFIYCFYRCLPSFVFLTCRYFFSNFAKGVIHVVLHYDYQTQMVLLCLVDIVVLLVLIYTEKKYTICITKSMFCLYCAYHVIFVMLNLMLYYQEIAKKVRQHPEDLLEIFLFMEQSVVYCLLLILSLQFFTDFIPGSVTNPIGRNQTRLSTKNTTIKQNDQQNQQKTIIQVQSKNKMLYITKEENLLMETPMIRAHNKLQQYLDTLFEQKKQNNNEGNYQIKFRIKKSK